MLSPTTTAAASDRTTNEPRTSSPRALEGRPSSEPGAGGPLEQQWSYPSDLTDAEWELIEVLPLPK
jgi:hypothetical protein